MLTASDYMLLIFMILIILVSALLLSKRYATAIEHMCNLCRK